MIIGRLAKSTMGLGTVSVSGLVSTPATFTSVIATSGSPAAIAVKNTSGTLYNVSLYCNNSMKSFSSSTIKIRGTMLTT